MLSASRRQPHLLHVSAVDRRQTWSIDKVLVIHADDGGALNIIEASNNCRYGGRPIKPSPSLAMLRHEENDDQHTRHRLHM